MEELDIDEPLKIIEVKEFPESKPITRAKSKGTFNY